jgi:hypothetical protein
MRRDSAHDIRKIQNFLTCVAWSSSDGKVSLGLPSPSFPGCEVAENLRLTTVFHLMYGDLTTLWCLGMVATLRLPFSMIISPKKVILNEMV